MDRTILTYLKLQSQQNYTLHDDGHTQNVEKPAKLRFSSTTGQRYGRYNDF